MLRAVTRTRLLELTAIATGALLVEPKVALARLRARSQLLWRHMTVG